MREYVAPLARDNFVIYAAAETWLFFLSLNSPDINLHNARCSAHTRYYI